ncbi:Uncharacterised protein [Vibrio cholerae]|nr:Uncharacterised protein [Vibrio cholerae]CSI68256.1 Uncharacterised protein [Vibrio cholerae]
MIGFLHKSGCSLCKFRHFGNRSAHFIYRRDHRIRTLMLLRYRITRSGHIMCNGLSVRVEFVSRMSELTNRILQMAQHTIERLRQLSDLITALLR